MPIRIRKAPNTMDPDWPEYKKEQFLAKAKLRPSIIHVGGKNRTLDLGIKAFKRAFKGDNKKIAAYKKFEWDQVREVSSR